jgi:hypothetical protein
MIGHINQIENGERECSVKLRRLLSETREEAGVRRSGASDDGMPYGTR